MGGGGGLAWNATWFGNLQIDIDGCLNICCPLSLPHCFNITTLKINLAPFLQEALCDNVMRNYILINFGC